MNYNDIKSALLSSLQGGYAMLSQSKNFDKKQLSACYYSLCNELLPTMGELEKLMAQISAEVSQCDLADDYPKRDSLFALFEQCAALHQAIESVMSGSESVLKAEEGSHTFSILRIIDTAIRKITLI